MTIRTQEQVDAMEAADSFLTSKGVLSPRDTSRDAEWWAALTKRSIALGSMTSEAYSEPSSGESPEPE